MAYIVKSGDTLSAIAQKNNTTVAELLKVNPNIKDPNLIYAGASLTMPTPATATPVIQPPTSNTTPVVNNNIPVGNVDVSIEDYLRSIGKPWDYSSRSVLAIQNGITNYTGTPEQNTKLLSILKGQNSQAPVVPVNNATPANGSTTQPPASGTTTPPAGGTTPVTPAKTTLTDAQLNDPNFLGSLIDILYPNAGFMGKIQMTADMSSALGNPATRAGTIAQLQGAYETQQKNTATPPQSEQPVSGYDVGSVEAAMDQLQKQGGMNDDTAKYWQDRDPIAFKNWAAKSGFKFQNAEYQKTLDGSTTQTDKSILDVIKDYGSYTKVDDIKTDATLDTSATFEKLWKDIYTKYNLGKYEQTAAVNLEKYFSDSYTKYAQQYDLTGLKTKVDSAQEEYDQAVEDLDKATGDINSNPWISESGRTGKISKLNSDAERTLLRLQNAIKIAQGNYDTSKTDAKEFATKDLATMQTERNFAVSQLNYYTDKVKDDLSLIVADKKAEIENEATKKKANQVQKELDFNKLEFIIENTVIPEAEQNDVYVELFRYFPEMAKEIEALKGKSSTIDSYVKGIESGSIKIDAVPSDLRNQVTSKVNWTKVPKTSSTTSATERMAENKQSAISGMTKQLSSVVGTDGKVSPDDYKKAKRAWLSAGYEATDFDNNFGSFRNTSHLSDYL